MEESQKDPGKGEQVCEPSGGRWEKIRGATVTASKGVIIRGCGGARLPL